MVTKLALTLFTLILINPSAYATNGSAFGTRFGNTIYEVLDQKQECGFGSDTHKRYYIRVAAEDRELRLHYTVDMGGYMSTRLYWATQHGTVSPTTLGASIGYTSSHSFESRESYNNKAGTITMDEQFFTLSRRGLLLHVTKINGVETGRCSYQKLGNY